MAEPSPFPFQGPLRAEEVAGRAALRTELLERITERRVTALLGPRRYGKTSLLGAISADLAEASTETVWVDLYASSSIADVAMAFDRALSNAPRGLLTRLSETAAGLSVRLGVLGLELSKPANQRPDPSARLHTLLQVLIEAAQKRSTLLVIDEFSGLAEVPQAAAILRTELQNHYRDLGIVFAGSAPSTMATLFGAMSQPFFAQADLVELGPMSDIEIRSIVLDGFDATSKSPGPALADLVAMSAGHPQRAMQLADALWRQTEKLASREDWNEALRDVRRSVNAASERLFDLLPGGQQKVLRAVAGGISPFGSRATVLGLPPGTATGAVKALLANGFLSGDSKNLLLVDPLVADWIRWRFPLS